MSLVCKTARTLNKDFLHFKKHVINITKCNFNMCTLECVDRVHIAIDIYIPYTSRDKFTVCVLHFYALNLDLKKRDFIMRIKCAFIREIINLFSFSDVHR